MKLPLRPQEKGGRLAVLLLLLLLLPMYWMRTAAAETFALNSGDRVVLLGATFVEREYRYGIIETLLTAQFHDAGLLFRNYAWSGDTVTGIARSGFETEKEGYERLLARVGEAEPTVILMSYGQNESFEGAAGLEKFTTDLERLLSDLTKITPRIVLISPTLQENLGAPLPDPAAHNADIRLYTEALAKIASARGLHFVDMTALMPVSPDVTATPLTDNGLHFTEEGYWHAAAALMKGLGYEAAAPDRERLAPLRAAIVEKNRLFFNVWRAQNDTYIYGFRKYEQGRFQEEVPLFLPLVAAQEERIASLCKELFGVDQPVGLGTP
ncbi:MAG: SGNH/GDSL hydrolase family protein [Candidatus Hydrogenedentes bacterium]|nr:SGNH/GDSL hydrolase family protein [Candidatus Hydrogenedentota bacterium]